MKPPPGVSIVNETFVRQFLSGRDPIGQSIQVNMTVDNPSLAQDRLREVVGVVRDVRMDVRAEFVPIMYVPYQQHLTDYAGNNQLAVHTIKHFAVRTSSDPMSVAPAVRRAFADVDSSVAPIGVMPMREALSAAAGGQAFWMRLLGIFAGLGVFLAAVGIYGVISYSVEQRTREFGIRATLGAQNADILKLVLREGLVVTVIGLVDRHRRRICGDPPDPESALRRLPDGPDDDCGRGAAAPRRVAGGLLHSGPADDEAGSAAGAASRVIRTRASHAGRLPYAIRRRSTVCAPHAQKRYCSGAGSAELPIRNVSTPRAALRPSAIAHTISDWPRCMSPAVKTPGTLVIQVASRHTLPRSVIFTPSASSIPPRSGPRNPIASSTRSASSAKLLPGTGVISSLPLRLAISTVTACSCLTRP